MLASYKKNPYIFKVGISYIILTYIFIPLILTTIGNRIGDSLQYNFFSFPAYMIILLALFIIYHRRYLIKYHHKPSLTHFWIWTAIAVFFFHLYVYFRFVPIFTYNNVDYYLLISWTFYILGTFAHAVSMFGYKLFKDTANSLAIFTFMVYFFYIITQLLWQLWDVLAAIVTKSVFFILSTFSGKAILTAGAGNKIGFGDFSVIVGPPCSGIESLSMFLGLFALLLVYEHEKLNLKRASIVLLFGLIGTYLVNVLRVTLLILIGTKYPEFALGAFHSQAGWVLFSLFVLGILYFFY